MARYGRVVFSEPLQRIGSRARVIESIFSRLPESVRTREVFLALCESNGIDEGRARGHWDALIALLPAAAKERAERGGRG